MELRHSTAHSFVKRRLLSGVAAPADGEAWCAESRERLRDLIDGQRIIYYKNPVQGETALVNATVMLHTRDVNEYLLRAGLTRYRDDGPFAQKYRAVAEEAQAAGRGVWGGEPPASRPNLDNSRNLTKQTTRISCGNSPHAHVEHGRDPDDGL